MENEKRTVKELLHEISFLKGMFEKNADSDATEAEKQRDTYFEGRFRGSAFAFGLSAKWLDEIIQKYEVKE